MRALGVAVLVVATLAGCGESDDGRSPTEGARTTTTKADGVAEDYVGLTKAAAIARAERADQPWRIGREDDEQFMLTQDFVEDRVTFEIDDGNVTQATLG